MKLVDTAELKAQANKILHYVENGHPVAVTRYGKVCAALEPITEADIDELVFQYSTRVRQMAAESAEDIQKNRYVTLREYLKGKRSYHRRSSR